MRTHRFPLSRASRAGTGTALALLLLAGACGREDPAPSAGPADRSPAAPDAAGEHGREVSLGEVTLLGRRFQVVREGEIVAGREGAFTVRSAGTTQAELAALNLFLWVESADGEALSASAKGMREGTGLHFHATPRAGAGAPAHVVLRLRDSGQDERARLPLDGHGHVHETSPNGGVMAAFFDPTGALAGHLELKLHDDAGDLELWLYEDAAGRRPFDLPLDATVRVTLIDRDDRVVTLRVRDRDQNPDEEGRTTVRDGRTNYFIFPGDSGEDATWLRGEGFQSLALAAFEGGGQPHVSEEFALVPHAHGGEDGHGHAHPHGAR